MGKVECARLNGKLQKYLLTVQHHCLACVRKSGAAKKLYRNPQDMSSGYPIQGGSIEWKILVFCWEGRSPKLLHGCALLSCLTCYFLYSRTLSPLTVAMESTVALHLAVHFSTESIGENAANCACSSEQPGASWKFPTLVCEFGFLVMSVFRLWAEIFSCSFEISTSSLYLIAQELVWHLMTYLSSQDFVNKILCTFFCACRRGKNHITI